MSTILLAIESSCDETSASVCADGRILSNIIANQSIHEKYGGVVPELASRAHMQHIVLVVDQALKQAGTQLSELNAIAFTQSPGLIGSLLVGAQFAKSLAVSLGVPLIGVHHMHAHVLANLIEERAPQFPFLCLTVSGGHTQIVLVHDYLRMEVIGQTQDDAVGEAFDKAAKIMGMPYPGGPLVDRYAQSGNPHAFRFPETSMPGLDFSFSGIKTAFLYFIRDEKKKNPDFVEQNVADICASLQHTLVSMLLSRLEQASAQTGIREIAMAGGVSANTGLRSQLQRLAAEKQWNVFIPAFEYCTDNAAMIAMAAHYKFLKKDFTGLDVTPLARMPV